MEMVSVGSIDWEPTPASPGTEIWSIDSEFAQGGSDGTFAMDTGGLADGTGTGILQTGIVPNQSDFNPGNIGGGFRVSPASFWLNNSVSMVFLDSTTGWLWGDIGNNGSIDGPASLINGNYWVDTDNNGSFDTNIGNGG